MTKPFWVGWEVPDDTPDEHMVLTWPEGMKGWCSGSGDDYTTWVGIVFAEDAQAAWAKVLSCYGESADCIRDRDFTSEMTKQPPENGRFPGAAKFYRDEMGKRAEVAS